MILEKSYYISYKNCDLSMMIKFILSDIIYLIMFVVDVQTLWICAPETDPETNQS